MTHSNKFFYDQNRWRFFREHQLTPNAWHKSHIILALQNCVKPVYDIFIFLLYGSPFFVWKKNYGTFHLRFLWPQKVNRKVPLFLHFQILSSQFSVFLHFLYPIWQYFFHKKCDFSAEILIDPKDEWKSQTSIVIFM